MNNAGVFDVEGARESEESEWDRILDRTSRRATCCSPPCLLSSPAAAADHQRRVHSRHRGRGERVAHCAAKFGLVDFTKAPRGRAARRGRDRERALPRLHGQHEPRADRPAARGAAQGEARRERRRGGRPFPGVPRGGRDLGSGPWTSGAGRRSRSRAEGRSPGRQAAEAAAGISVEELKCRDVRVKREGRADSGGRAGATRA